MTIRELLLKLFLCVPIGLSVFASDANATPPPPVDNGPIRFAQLALNCVHTEYPNKIAHVLLSDADAKTPHELTPAFYGCFDWHSSVHGHWLLARYAHYFPNGELAASAKTALMQSLTPENIATEVAYITGAGRASFERPYGLAWLLQLGTELRQWGETDADARKMANDLLPLEMAASAKLKTWLPKLLYPVRVGEHSQTAFGLGLALDWARVANDTELEALIIARSRVFYLADKDCPIAFEPSGEDFLSPCLGEASLMARILPSQEFASWLRTFLPTIPNDLRGPVIANSFSRPNSRATNIEYGVSWLPIAIISDRSDPKLAHLDGLNLSRAWMLKRILRALPATDRRRMALTNTWRVHAEAALPFVTGEHYEGGHWLGTFAMYLQSDTEQRPQ
jgi:hypothetical protein